VSGDPGSATFVLGANADHPSAYLNETPATEEEQLGIVASPTPAWQQERATLMRAIDAVGAA